MWGFAPVSADAPEGTEDVYDCLVATDVLAESVNLQQARHIINYDLPWNPMRLVQRHGRIDHIGSPHKRVHLRCFSPSALLDELLGLEAVLQRKIAQAAASVGVEDEITPGAKRGEVVLQHTRTQIDALKAEGPTLFETAEDTGALSREEFRRELADRMADTGWAEQVENLPWVAGSGRTVDGPGGYVFCVRVGDHPRPVYRYVPLSEDGQLEVDNIADDTLTALSHASCTPGTARVLPDPARGLAYDAWEAAKKHIAERWWREGDPRAVARPVPKPMREAADILRNNPLESVSSEQLYPLLDAIEAPDDNRTQRMMRAAINNSDAPQQQAQAIVDLVDELALEPPTPIEPLPEIDLDDVHLVCWIALCPRDARAEAQ